MRIQARSPVDALFPRIRQGVLAALLIRPDEELHLRDLVRRVQAAPATVQREVLSLTGAGILERRKVGRQVYYRANRRSPVFAELQSLMLKTVGLADLLRGALEPLGEKVECALVFGSVADGTATADSDLDLLVVGEATLGEVAPHLRAARATLGRETNVVTMSRAAFREGLQQGDGFLTTLMSRPIITVKGDPHELGGPRGAAASAAADDLATRDR
jgi:predicted nucleotidyltransferase